MGWSFVGNVVIHCSGGEWVEEKQRVEGAPRELGEFYAELLGWRVIRDDWIKVGKDVRSFPQLAIDGIRDAESYRRPRWGDPEYPHQLCLEITVTDLVEAGAVAVGLGGVMLEDCGDARAYADPAGHPFWLLSGEERRIAGVVIDCFSPRSLAVFYEKLLGMHRVRDEPGMVVVKKEGGIGLDTIAFRHVPTYVAPRWGDDAFHQQLHMDMWFEDADGAQREAEELGAVRLPHWSKHPVLADPAGHPFCLLRAGQ